MSFLPSCVCGQSEHIGLGECAGDEVGLVDDIKSLFECATNGNGSGCRKLGLQARIGTPFRRNFRHGRTPFCADSFAAVGLKNAGPFQNRDLAERTLCHLRAIDAVGADGESVSVSGKRGKPLTMSATPGVEGGESPSLIRTLRIGFVAPVYGGSRS